MGPSLREIEAFLATVTLVKDEVNGDALMRRESWKEVDDYWRSQAARFWHTLKLMARWLPSRRPLRILEVGAAPYFFTAVMHRYVPCSIVGVNVQAGVWPGEPRSVRRCQVQIAAECKAFNFDVYVLNVERDRFPFEASSFDAVLCMEVIEHLGYSPTHMLAQIHRVLGTDGLLVLSTPNAVSLERMAFLLLNRSPYFPYSGYGFYGRHQREFTLDELVTLTEACNYQILEARYANVYPRPHYSLAKRIVFKFFHAVTSLPIAYLQAKREYLFVMARPIGEPRLSYPESLYYYPHLYPQAMP